MLQVLIFVTLFLVNVQGQCPCEISYGLVTCESGEISNFPDDFSINCPDIDPLEIKGFDLQGQLITEIVPHAFSSFPNLVSLAVGFNGIKEIHQDSFYGLGHLTGLYLQNNSISYIEDGAFDQLVSLKELDMSSNPLTSYTTR